MKAVENWTTYIVAMGNTIRIKDVVDTVKTSMTEIPADGNYEIQLKLGEKWSDSKNLDILNGELDIVEFKAFVDSVK